MNYSGLGLAPEILKGVEEMGFEEMTEIQQKAIPEMLAGHDVIAKAPTGTGKTCAFGVPLVSFTDPSVEAVQSLILCPTRELAMQIRDELMKIGKYVAGFSAIAVYGGQSIQKQRDLLKHKPQIIVATPGRLIDFWKHGAIKLEKITRIVLDEADEMLDLGFYKDVCYILNKLKSKKQLAMFSATISREVMDIGWLYQRDPVELVVAPVAESRPNIKQYSIESAGTQKIEDIAHIIKYLKYSRVMVFCNTKYQTESLSGQFKRRGVNSEFINGDMAQSARNTMLKKFKSGEIEVLVATDVAARGLDISDVDVVFNFDIPQDNEYYIHRIGRTGRAKRDGVSYIFYAPDEKRRLETLLKYTKSTVIPLKFDQNRVLVEK